MPRFKVGDYMRKCKEDRNLAFMKKRNLMNVQEEIVQLENELKQKDKVLRSLVERKRRMDSKVSALLLTLVLQYMIWGFWGYRLL